MSQRPDPTFAAPAATPSRGERFLIGFFVLPGGDRRFDCLHLTPDPDGWSGALTRLGSGESEADRFALQATETASRLEITLDALDGAARQRLTVDARTQGSENGHIATLDGRADDPSPLPRLAYILEEVGRVRLAPSPTHGWGVVARQAIAKGEEVLIVRGPIGMNQTPYSFRCATGQHVEPTGYGHFVNHSCVPSCHIAYREGGRPCLIANRDLEPDDEVTFDYTLTEGALANAFDCRCPAEIHKV